jgi:hypothetical protein
VAWKHFDCSASTIEQDLGIWNHLGVVVNWLLGKHLGKQLGACRKPLGEALGKAPGEDPVLLGNLPGCLRGGNFRSK